MTTPTTGSRVRPRRPSAGRRLARWAIGLAILAIVLIGGAEAVYRVSILPDAAKSWGKQAAEIDKACDSRNAATAEALLSFRNSPFYHERIGFRQPPGWSLTTTNLAGASWSIWTNAEGARVANAQDQGRSLQAAPIHIYGDSLAASAEVDYEQAWATLLEKRSGRAVANFGSFGGGFDQAWQYLAWNLEQGFRPRQVVLELVPETVTLLAGQYQCFLTPASDVRAWSKPRYIERGGRWAWSEHPMAQLAADNVAGYSARVARHDFFGQRLRASHAVVDARLGAIGLAHYIAHREMLETPRDVLLTDIATRRMLATILDEVSAAAKTHGFKAWVLLLPQSPDEMLAFRTGRREESEFAGYLQRETGTRGIGFINGPTILARKTDLLGKSYERYSLTPTWGLPSETGNRAIADVVAAPVLKR